MRVNGEQHSNDIKKMRKKAFELISENNKREKGKTWKRLDHKTIILVK